MESVVDDVRKVKAESVVDEATDSVVDAMDCRLGTKEVAIVELALADNPAFSEDDMVTDTASSKDVARVADKCVAVEGAVSTGLEEILSALMMSAAFARKLGSHSCALESIFFTPFLQLHILRPANVQLGSQGRSLRRPPSNSGCLRKPGVSPSSSRQILES